MIGKHELPDGWYAAGIDPLGYDMIVDETVTYDGRPSLLVMTKREDVNFGTVMQRFKADDFLGKRLRYRAMMRTADIDPDDGSAQLWMRIDRKDGTYAAFDNMYEQRAVGTTDWKEYTIVLNVAANSAFIAFGMLLGGTGKAWLTNIRFDVVGDDVPLTSEKVGYSMSDEPLNLFSDA